MEIGSVWHHQRLVFTPTLQGHPDSVLTVSIADPQQAGSIPLHTLAQWVDIIGRFHPFGNLDNQSLASSPCHILEGNTFTIRNGERIDMLILPPAELLRFYYCGSANLLK